MNAVVIPLAKLRIDGGTQPRLHLNTDTVDEYAFAMIDGAEFPPLSAVFDGSDYWLWDGIHRYHAAKCTNQEEISVVVTQGTIEDAKWLCLSANQTHGLRRSTEDKRNAVELALKLKPDTSDSAIAEHCGVDHKTVAAARVRLTREIPKSTTRTGRDGRTTNTANIGRKPASEREPGDDTESEAAAKVAEKARPKPGQVLYDWREFYSKFGAIYREIDKIGNAYRCKETPAAEGLRRQLIEFKTTFKGWYKTVAKQSPPEE